jgi:ABC-type lipoprotein release transport system permease subunit
MLVLKLAWRSIWRNRTRTLITTLGIMVGVMMVVFSAGFAVGFSEKMVRASTQSRSGEAQLTATGWAKTLEETNAIGGLGELLERVDASPKVEAAAPRIVGFGLISIGSRSRGVQLLGVDPAREKEVTNWETRLVDGEYLLEPGDMMIGAKLAEDLEVEVGAKLILTGADVNTGEAATELVRVRGLLVTGDNGLDEGAAIVHIAQAQRVTGLEDSAHVIALDVAANTLEPEVIEADIAPFASEAVEARSWRQINGMIAQVHEMMGAYMDLVLFMIFLIISFGIVNTISMSLLERKHEFGVMRAIGTSPWQLAGQIVAEAFFLGLVGAVPGMLAGLGLNAYYARVGMNFSEMNAYGMTFVDPIYTLVDVPGAVRTAVIFTILTALAATVSAVRVARLKPVDAMRD